MPLKIKLRENSIRLAYKLSVDLLFLVLFFFVSSLISESLVPGIVISHIGFSKIILLLSANLLLVHFLSRLGQAPKDFSPEKKADSFRSTAPWLLLVALLTANEFLRVNLFFNLFLVALILLSSFWIYELFFEKNKKV